MVTRSAELSNQSKWSRSTTSEYGMSLLDNDGNLKKRKVGIKLITLAINENSSNTDTGICMHHIGIKIVLNS